jgi:hypothetical protein
MCDARTIHAAVAFVYVLVAFPYSGPARIGSNVTIAKVDDQGLLEDDAQVSVRPNNSFIKCIPNSPPAAYNNRCGSFYGASTSYPGGVAISRDGKGAYALLNQNDTLTKINLAANPAVQGHRSVSATRRTVS